MIQNNPNSTVRRGLVGLLLAGFVLGASPLQAAEMAPRELPRSLGRATVELRSARNDADKLRTLDLERGRSIVAHTDYSVKRVSVGDPELLDVVVLTPREIQLVAKGVGSTNLVLWSGNGAPEAAIEVRIGTPHSQIEGELARIFPNESIQVDAAGNSVVVKGRVSSAVVQEQALEVTRAFFGDKPTPVINLLEVGGNHQVMIEVVIAEMSRRIRKRLGTNFAASIQSGGQTIELLSFLGGLSSLTPIGAGAAAAGTILLDDDVNLVGNLLNFGSGNYQLFLDLLNQEGLARILAEPTLVARSGESASFLAGGEVPIPIAQGGAFGSITIEFKKFGVGVLFTPTVLGPDRIHLQVSPEVSEPDFTFGTTVSGTTVPGFNTRRASTGVELADGQSFAIAGLLRDDISELTDRYPVLGDLPILGTLFRSDEFLKQETELVLIVTPHLVKPLGPGPHPLPTDSFIEPSEFEFYLLGRLEGRGDGAPGASAQATPTSGGLIGAAGHRIGALPKEIQ